MLMIKYRILLIRLKSDTFEIAKVEAKIPTVDDLSEKIDNAIMKKLITSDVSESVSKTECD